MGLMERIFNKKQPKQDETDEIPPYVEPPRDTKIRMLRSTTASNNGIKTERFWEGQEYMVSRKLAATLVEELQAAVRVEG